MQSIEFLLLSYLLNSLWQVPLIGVASYLAARAARSISPLVEHRVWVGALLLQITLPACAVLPTQWLHAFSFFHLDVERAAVSVAQGPATVSGALHLPRLLLASTAAVYFVTVCYFTVRLFWRYRKTVEFGRTSIPLACAAKEAVHAAICAEQLTRPEVALAVSPNVFGPVVIGIRRKLLLLPPDFLTGLPPEDIRALLAHEFAHVSRNDFAKNLLYQVLALPVAYHPLLRSTVEQLSATREMVCDRLAADLSSSNTYAHSLLRLATLLAAPKTVHYQPGMGIVNAGTLERRLMELTTNRSRVGMMRRTIALTACACLGVLTCASALALRTHIGVPLAYGSGEPIKADAPVSVSQEVMAGKILDKVNPKYPEAAKKAKIQGTVLLNTIIGKDGTVEHLDVASGPEELAPSALDAVRQWIYKPYLLNGDPVEVQSTVTVTYTLAK